MELFHALIDEFFNSPIKILVVSAWILKQFTHQQGSDLLLQFPFKNSTGGKNQ